MIADRAFCSGSSPHRRNSNAENLVDLRCFIIRVHVGRDGAIGWRWEIRYRCLQGGYQKSLRRHQTWGNRIATCLKEHVADLSDACKARLADVAAARKTCGADIEKQQCGTKSRIQKVTCIKDAIANLGDECKAAIAAVVTSKR